MGKASDGSTQAMIAGTIVVVSAILFLIGMLLLFLEKSQ